MAFSQIADVAPNYRDYGGWWLKAYEPGTTTPKAMSDNSTGEPQAAKYQLNVDGFIVSDGNALAIPFIDGDYDLFLFPTEDEANDNDTINALRLADDISKSNGLDDKISYSFNSTGNLKAGTINGNDISLLLKSLITVGDITASTIGYYGAYSSNKTPTGGAKYILSTLARVRDEKGESWVPDTYGEYYLFGGTEYIAVLNEDSVTVDMFGGVPDYDRDLRTGTDNQPSLNAAELYCLANKKELRITGDFGVGSQTIAQAITRKGIGSANCGLFALNDNHRIYSWDSEITTGVSIMMDFKIQGYAQDNMTQGSDSSALLEISPIDEAYFIRMEGAYSRQMGFKSRAKFTMADYCHIHHLLRDGINFTDAKTRIVTNNRCEYIGDDAIACHSNATNPITETVITGNYIYNCFGIKCLSSNFTISNNRGKMVFGYGVEYGNASGFAEGEVDTKVSVIHGNSFENIINLTYIGGGNLGAGIYARPPYEPNDNDFYPNQFDTTDSAFVDPLAENNVYGEDVPHAGAQGVSIKGNVLRQTWTGGSVMSDYGEGNPAWTAHGFDDVAITGTLGKDGNSCYAYRFDYVIDNVTCDFDQTYGFTKALFLNRGLRFRNSTINLGAIERISYRAIDIIKDSSITDLHCESVVITGGSLDMDPLCEHDDRTLSGGIPTGAWDDAGGINCVGLYAPNVTGLIWEKTQVRNVQSIYYLSGGGVIKPLVRDLIVSCGDGVGVGDVDTYANTMIYTDCDPSSATFNQTLQGNMYPQYFLPTSGYYFAGQRIKNNDYTAVLSGIGEFSEMVRLTTGNGHVLHTDWAAVPLTI